MPALEKEKMYQEIEKEFNSSNYVFFSNFEALSVSDLSKARNKMNVNAKRSMLVKHAMARKILKSRGIDNIDSLLKGSVLLTFGDKEPQDISKGVVDGSKVSEKIKCVGVLFEGRLESAQFVQQLSKLPSRHELLTQLAVSLNGPITGLASVLSNTIRGLAISLDQVGKQKGAASASN
ncbi:MAG TPA: 50S ribosomal protein L10 [Candidatus Omnitrophota bacterium]|nr:50S ribosomal protein L10 [Candidatus Omnitrophota bacterium]HRK61350.1 50S ribosomal protein L10 [Candidatus Omnitrophota bacterium]